MIYLKEKDIDRIEKENSQIKSEVPGKYLSEITNKYELTEKLLEKYRELKFHADNAFGIMLHQAEKSDFQDFLNNNDKYRNINIYCKEQIEEAVRKIKTYPKYGQIYYKILQYRFLLKDFYTYETIAKMNKTSKQNILQKKNEAIHIVADILWDTVPSDIALYFAEYQIKARIDRTENITST